MPSTTLCGVRLRNLSDDFMPFYVLIAVVQVVWLFIYWIGIAAFERPETCDPGTRISSAQQYAAVFVMLGLFIAQAAATCAMALLTLKGTPLEPSKRRWVGRLLHAFLISLPINAGVLAWAAWVVNAGDGSCWSSGNKSMPNATVFGGYGVILGQVIGFLISYNQLGDAKEGNWWHALTRTGISSVVHLVSSYGAQQRGPTAQLEQMVTELQRRLGAISADKTDAAAALACAALLQDEALASGGAAEEATGEPAGKADGGALLAWAQGVCQGAAAAAASQPAGRIAPAGEDTAAEALHWARFAAAAYGARQHGWQRGKVGSCAARKQLARLAAAAAAEGAQPLAGWGGMAAAATPDGGAGSPAVPFAKPSSAQLKDFAAARELLGAACQIVALGRGDKKAGLPPHLVAVDREKRAVVLGIAGNWRRPHAVPDAVPAPAGCLTGCATAAAEQGSGADGSSKAGVFRSWVHGESLVSAEALLLELERSQLLHQLLRGPAGGAAGPLAGLECSGWQLVVVGHGVGAGAAALLAPKLAGAQLGQLAVWAFGPPGELCSSDLAASLAGSCRLAVVALGDDAAPRTTSPTVGTLLDQGVVGLARLRYPKMGLFAAMVAERLGPNRWRGRWLVPHRAMRPLCEVPEEALGYLQRYHDAQLQQDAPPSSSLPGRVLLLSRVPAVAEATGGGDQAPVPGDVADDVGSCGSSGSSSSTGQQQRWQAAWASGEQLAAWGIRSSRLAMSDHYVSRLLGVLGDLATRGDAGAAAEGGVDEELGAADSSAADDSHQPLRAASGHAHPVHAHTHSD